ncbi:MAG: polysaccharide biosynthesis C-terminal domain-containing protein [Chloroflexi bacterium]|nr:polysaccharide biosynthesis C-terminal domain-containing protein [Chloroflexota bacterium]MBP8055285.1 polysaccharide biosynthesis C-terminal domain-containing protein [Chloroflexota bacterium]
MLMQLSKQRRRILLVATNSLNNLLLPIFNVGVSLLVIRLASVTLWGEFVNVLLTVQLGAHVISWGNKEYLLRAFSFNPSDITRPWQTAFLTRLLLYLGFMVVMSLGGWPLSWLIIIWVWGLGLMVAQAAEVLVVYRRAFVFAVLVELTSVLFLLGSIAGLGDGLTMTRLLALFCAAQAGKAAALIIHFRRQTLNGVRGRVDSHYFLLALPFFLLGFTGMLQSRIDLYSVSYFLSREEVGQYQVLTGFLLYLQALANFILTPFVKSLYRLQYEIIRKISRRLFGLGLLLVPPAMGIIYWLLVHVYHFTVSPWLLLVGGLHVLPLYFTLPIIYALYKSDQQKQVFYVNLVNILLDILLNIWWIPHLGLMGALLSTMLTSWLTLLFYWYRGRALRTPNDSPLPDLPSPPPF